MHLLFTVDDQYVPVLGTCMQSILRFPCAQGYDLYILHAGLSAVSIQYLKKVTQSHARLHLISIDAHSFDEFPQNARYPKTMYYSLSMYFQHQTVISILLPMKQTIFLIHL